LLCPAYLDEPVSQYSSWAMGLDCLVWGLSRGKGKRFVSSLNHPDLLHRPPSNLFSGYGGLLLGGKAAWAWGWQLTSTYVRMYERT